MTAPRIEDELFIEVSWLDGSEPWLSGATGRFDLDRLVELAQAVRVDSYPLEDAPFGRYLFRMSWFPGQFGEFGEVEFSPCYEMVELVLFETWGEVEAAETRAWAEVSR